MIRIQNLTTYYGTRKILDSLSLDIQDNETLAILGRSGCGKSTLFRHIVGLQKPSEGSIHIDDQDIVNATDDQMNTVRKNLGILFQSGALLNSLTVGENIALPLREHTELDDHIISMMVRINLELVGLSGFENLLPSQLSGGMKKRAGLARAMIMDPKILLADEPSAGLDPIVSAGIDELFLRLKSIGKFTIIVVTHEMKSAFTIADRIVILFQGKVLAVGTPSEIRESSNQYIQDFLNGVTETVDDDPEAYIQRIMNGTVQQ